MADYSDIAGFEDFMDALSSVGIDGVSPEVAALGGLSALNQAFYGQPITEYDAQQIAILRNRVDGFLDDGFVQLRALSERDFDTLGLNDSSANPLANNFDPQDAARDLAARSVINAAFRNLSIAQAMPDLLRTLVEQEQFSQFAPLVDQIPPNFMQDIPATLDLVEDAVRGDNGALSYFDIVEEMASRGAFNDIDPADLSSVDSTAQQRTVIEQVEIALAVPDDARDGVWGGVEQAALKAKITEMQAGDDVWQGEKNGLYSRDYTNYVLSDAYESPNKDADQALFTNLVSLEDSLTPLLSPADDPVTPQKVSQSTFVVEEALKILIPIAQNGLDERRAGAEHWIYGRPESQMLIDGATEFLASGQGTPEQREQAQEYLDNVGGFETNDAINMIEMLKLGSFENDWFTKTLEKLPQAVKDNINLGFARFHDLPDVDSLNLDDGILDMNDQRALQGVLVLMGQKLGLNNIDPSQYTPEMGQQFVAKIDAMNLDQIKELLDGEPLAQFNALSNDQDRVAFLEARKDDMIAIFAALNTLDRADVLSKKPLYQREEIKIPDVTTEIFAEFIAEDGVSPQDVALLNNITHAYIDGFDLHTVLGADHPQVAGIDPIDTTKDVRTRFAELYENGVDQEALTYILMMLDALPYGEKPRRDGMKQIIADANRAVENAEEGADLAAIWADAIANGLEALNANPETHSDYIHQRDRQPVLDPRLHDFSVTSNGREFDGDQIFDLLKAKNDNWTADHEPLIFSADDGKNYVAVMDVESHMILVEELDLTGWENAVNSTARVPGETVYQYGDRVHENLKDVSGYDLIFQYRGGRLQALHSNNRTGFHNDMAGNIRPLGEQATPIMAAQSTRQAERAAEAAAEQAERARPRGVAEELGLGGEFGRSAEGAEPGDSFGANAAEITAPAQGTTPVLPTPSTPEVVLPNGTSQ